MSATEPPRERLLQAVWQEIRSLNVDNVGHIPAARRAIEGGASPKDLVCAMTAASYETAFRLLFLLSAEHAEEGNTDPTVGWVLTGADLVDSGEAVPNGNRSLDFLHEDLLGRVS